MNETPLSDPIDDLLDVLDLEREGTTTVSFGSPTGRVGESGEVLEASERDVFLGRSQPQPHGRVFGGQVLAQCIVAAGRTVTPVSDGEGEHDEAPGERYIHSMHGYFLRPGDANKPIRFLVERMRDGGSFSSRRVHAVQEGRILLSLITSFQEESAGLEHETSMPDLPGPEELTSDRDILERVDHPVARHSARNRALDLRHVEPLLLMSRTPGPAQQSVWMRVERQLPDDPLLHAAILAYASDYVLLEPVLRRHGIGWGDPRLRAASLDHSMWFHRPAARIDDWVLYTQTSPSSRSGRGLGQGAMYSVDGALLASVAQEGMVRLKD